MIKNKNIRAGALYTLFSFVNNGISFLLILVLANFLAPEAYGYLNLFNTFVTLLSLVIALSTNSYLTNAFFQKTRREMKQVLLLILLTATGGLIAAMAIAMAFSGAVTRIVGVPLPYLLMGIFICYFQIYTNLTLDTFRLEEKPVSYGIFTMSMALLNFAATFVFIVGMKQGWEGRVFAQLGVTAMFFLVSIFSLTRRGFLQLNKPSRVLWIETMAFALPLIPHSLSFWLKQGMDRYIINFFWDAENVGLYSFAMNFASIIAMVGNAFNSNNSVQIMKSLSSPSAQGSEVKVSEGKGLASPSALEAKVSGGKRLGGFLTQMTLLFLGISAAVWLGSAVFIPWVLPKYAESVQYLLPLCAGAFFQCVYLLYVNYLFYYKRTRTLMYITFSTALVQLALSMWLTRYSPLATAYVSMFISLITALLVRHFALSRQNNERKR